MAPRTPRPFEEEPPVKPQRKPPVLKQIDRDAYAEGKSGQKKYEADQAAAQAQYNREDSAYQQEQADYKKDLEGWRTRKADWDKNEGAPSERLTNYLASPEGRSQKFQNYGALAAPMLPAAVLSTLLNKGISSPGRKIGYGALELGAGEGLRELIASQQPDEYIDPSGHYGNQFWQNLMLSSGVGGMLGSVRSALMKGEASQNALNGPTGGPTPPQPSPYKGLTPTEASKKMLEDLGAQSTKTLGGNLKALPQAIKGAPEGALRKVATEWPGVDGSESDLGAVRNSLESSAKKTLAARRKIPLAAPLFFGAEGAALGSDAASNQARAAGLEDTAAGRAAPYAGGAAGAAAGYGAYRGIGAGLNALAEASPVAARMLGLGSRALPIAGNALLARDIINRGEASHQLGMEADRARAQAANETYPLLARGAELSEANRRPVDENFQRALQEFKDHFSPQQPQQ